MEYIYIQTEYAIKLHNKIISVSWGRNGEINVWLLDSVLAHIQNDDYYPTFNDKLTHLIYWVAKNHAFIDGNKRTALDLWSYFIWLNFSNTLANEFIIAFENTIVHVVNSVISKELLCEIISAFMQWDINREDILLKIYHALDV